MEKFLLVLAAMAFGFGVLIVGSLIGAVFFWVVWNHTVAELFPHAIGDVPAVLTLWQAFKLMFLLGVLGKSFKSNVEVNSK